MTNTDNVVLDRFGPVCVFPGALSQDPQPDGLRPVCSLPLTTLLKGRMMKKTTASTPQGLASANAAYCQRMAQLAQESQQRWIELGRAWPAQRRAIPSPRWRPCSNPETGRRLPPRWAK
ncbi:hypothetical protein [Achromobacter insolitus]|uniref:hypothetical protein n=1 Tax=Achromobacter insolitus TaxID=217204 RepID=UPI001FCA44E7|nr:hypothetical protein [Achromobacter insolitus]